MNRRGFLAMLGGAVLAKAVGPIEIVSPAKDLWTAAPNLPLRPLINQYVPLEAVCAQMMDVMQRELAWLRLKHRAVPAETGARFGDTQFVREDIIFRPAVSISEPPLPGSLMSRHRRVDLVGHSCVDLLIEPGMPWDEYSKQFVEPAAQGLVDGMIHEIRRLGGGEYLVTAPLGTPPPDVARGCVQTDRDSGFTIRAMDWNCPLDREAHVRVDVLLGVG